MPKPVGPKSQSDNDNVTLYKENTKKCQVAASQTTPRVVPTRQAGKVNQNTDWGDKPRTGHINKGNEGGGGSRRQGPRPRPMSRTGPTRR